MNKRIRLTRKMLELQTVGEGESYPHMSMLSHKKSVGDTLTELQLLGYRLRRILPPWQLGQYRDGEPRITCYKLRLLFVMERNGDPAQQEFVKGGFLYETPEQLEKWLREAQ